MDSFVDTNIPIAYVFSIDPHNKKSEFIFDNYDAIYWSKNVYDEFSLRCDEKLCNLIEFYEDFEYDLENWPKEVVRKKDMIKYLNGKNYEDEKFYKDIKSSFDPILDRYVESIDFVNVEVMLNGIHLFIDDLKANIYNKIDNCEITCKCTPYRKNKYGSLYNALLKKPNVHESDVIIVLDAHDYNLGLKEKIDFITFDKGFYNAVFQFREFSFNKILGIHDFF